MVFESELRQRLFRRAGQPLIDPQRLMGSDASSIREVIDTQRDWQARSICSLYTKKGFYDTKIRIDIEPLDGLHVKMNIAIEPGRRYRLGDVYIRGHRLRTYSELVREFSSAFDLGSNFIDEDYTEAIASIEQLYRDEGYLQVRLDHRANKDPKRGLVDVYLDIDEGARWQIDFEGARYFTRDQLLEALTFNEVGFVDQNEIDNSKREIQVMYRTSGFYWAEVDAEVEERGPSEQRLVFRVTEHRRAEVETLKFCAVTDERPWSRLRTKPRRPSTALRRWVRAGARRPWICSR